MLEALWDEGKLMTTEVKNDHCLAGNDVIVRFTSSGTIVNNGRDRCIKRVQRGANSC